MENQAWEYAGFACAHTVSPYCESTLEGSFDIEHMVPPSRGGRIDWTNLAVTCEACDRSGGSLTTQEVLAKMSDEPSELRITGILGSSIRGREDPNQRAARRGQQPRHERPTMDLYRTWPQAKSLRYARQTGSRTNAVFALSHAVSLATGGLTPLL